MWIHSLQFMDLFARTVFLDMTFVKQCNIAVLFYPMTTHRAAEDRTIFCVWTKQRWTRKLQYCYTWEQCFLSDRRLGHRWQRGDYVGGYMKDTLYSKVQNYITKGAGAEAKTWKVKVYLSPGKHTVHMTKMLLKQYGWSWMFKDIFC